jgi:NarL family two-component system response regulator YdfI
MAVDDQRTGPVDYARVGARLLYLAAGVTAVVAGASDGFGPDDAPMDLVLADGFIALALLGGGALWWWARYAGHTGDAAAVWPLRRGAGAGSTASTGVDAPRVVDGGGGAQLDRRRILVANASPVVRQGVRAMVQPAPDLDVVAEAADGEEAVRLAHEARPDVLMVDLGLPGLDGVEVVRQLRRTLPHLAVVVFTPDAGPVASDALARVGGAARLPKTADGATLCAALRAAGAGQREQDGVTAPDVAPGRGTADIGGTETTDSTKAAGGAGRAGEAGAPPLPTRREAEVLVLVARGLHDREIAGHLGVSIRTVRAHLEHLRAKLCADSRATSRVELLRRAWAAGWLPSE